MRDAIERALLSLRVASARIETAYSDAQASREEIQSRLRESAIFLGVYDRSYVGDLSVTEFEFDQAQDAKKPTLVFVKNIKHADFASPRQQTFLGQVEEQSAGKFSFFQFDSADQLENLIASTVQELLNARFALQVKRAPFHAPHLPETFIRRDPLLQQILTALVPGKTVVLHGFGAIGGAGKTLMATAAAHAARTTFVDGVLWADISTMRSADILMNWARQYGGLDALGRGDLRFIFRPLSLEALQLAETTARIDALGERLRGKRVLAILDGVIDERDEEKIQPLVTALSGCAILITSRTTQISALRSATLIEIPRLTEDETWQLFNRIAGEERTGNHRALVTKIARVVDFLPLALEMVAAQFREDESWTLNALALALEKERANLDALHWGYTSARGMQTALNTSYRRLSRDAQKYFTMLGAFAGYDFDASAATFATDTNQETSAELLEQLTKLGFVQQGRYLKRFTLHPVLRMFARNQLSNLEANGRMAAYYCAIARENGKKLQGDEVHSALKAIDTELSNIFAGHQWAQSRNDRAGWELCRDYVYGAMTYYFNLKSMWTDWIAWSVVGVEACYKLGDEKSASSLAGSLGMVSFRRGEFSQAVEFYKQALAVMEKLGLQAGAATIHMNLGNVHAERREWKDAVDSFSISLQLFERLNNLHGLAQARANLGMLYAKYGDRIKARANWQQALEIFNHLDDQREADIVRKWLKTIAPPEFR